MPKAVPGLPGSMEGRGWWAGAERAREKVARDKVGEVIWGDDHIRACVPGL